MKCLKYFVLVSVVLLMGTKSVYADSFYYGVFRYNYINDGNELEVDAFLPYGDSVYDNVVIPEEVTYMNRTRKVTRIGSAAFIRNKDFKTVTIPNTITSIGMGAFAWSDLLYISIPESVTEIGSEAFLYCQRLYSVSLPNGLKTIGKGAFGNTDNLESIDIPYGITEIADNAFENSGLKRISIPESIESIGNQAFCNCSLESITIPNSVKTIGTLAFYNDFGLKTITLPESITNIKRGAFDFCVFLETVISHISEPFAMRSDVFYSDTYYNATLYVPIGTLDKYKSTSGWNDFHFIEEGNPTGITESKLESDKESKRYSLNGEIISSPQKGINIIRMDNGTTRKVVVK